MVKKKEKKKRFVCMFMSLCLGMYEGNDLPVTLLTFTVSEGEPWPVQGLAQCCPGWFQPAGSSWQTDPGLPSGNQPLHLVHHGGSRGHLEKPAKNYQGTNLKCNIMHAL